MLSAVVSGLVAAAASGCSQGEAGSADCDARVRVAGVVYTAVGTTRRPATRGELAEEAACHDVGEDAAGSVFLDRPAQVRTWTFGGHDPAREIGVRLGPGAFRVFVADGVAPVERRRVVAELGRPEGPRREKGPQGEREPRRSVGQRARSERSRS